MALATQQDVEVSMLRPLSETEMRYLSDLLERAERLLLARIPDPVSYTHLTLPCGMRSRATTRIL